MSRRVLLRSPGRCCLGLLAVLVAGGAAEVLPVSLNCPLPLRRTYPSTLNLDLNCMSACRTFLIMELLHWVKELYKRMHCSAKPVKLQGLQATLSHNAPGRSGVSDSENLFSTAKSLPVGGYPSLYLVVRRE